MIRHLLLNAKGKTLTTREPLKYEADSFRKKPFHVSVKNDSAFEIRVALFNLAFLLIQAIQRTI